jgi:serine/threonine protein phosphatase PrpC
VDLALQRGAPDNTTVVAVFVQGPEEAGAQPLKKAKLLLTRAIDSFRKIAGRIR